MYLLSDLWQRLSLRLLLYWGLLCGALWLFVALAEDVYEQQGFFFDEPVLTWFHTLLNPTLTTIMLALSTFGGVLSMVVLSLVVTLVLLRLNRQEAVFFGSSMLGASIIMIATKYLFARPRPALFPDVNAWQTHSPSFPSGHATGSAAFFLALYLVIARLAPRWRHLVGLAGFVLVVGICASRLYLQVHYPSDILAGLALGVAWVLGANSLYTYHNMSHRRRTVLLTLSKEVIDGYQHLAKQQGRSADALMNEVLQRDLGLANLEPEVPSTPAADPALRQTKKGQG